jgi:hypothetical protein
MRPTLARALAASLLALALTACGAKKEDPAPAPTGSGSGSASASAPAPTPPPPRPAPPTPAAPAIDGLPDTCNEYRQTIQRLASCSDALPQATRANLQSHFEQQWTGWQKLPDQDKRTLAAICKSSSDNVKAAAAAGCGW